MKTFRIQHGNDTYTVYAESYEDALDVVEQCIDWRAFEHFETEVEVD